MPRNFRFRFAGINLVTVPDSIRDDQWASALNIRSYSPYSIQTRPGYKNLFSTGGHPITDIHAYATLGTDSLPRYLVRDSVGGVYLDINSGTPLTTMASPQGYGAFMASFRPAASPQSWMYIATQGDYQKFSAPSPDATTVVNQKVGIAEPQTQLEASPVLMQFTDFTGVAATPWTIAGTAGAVSDSYIIAPGTYTVGAAVIADPVGTGRVSVQVAGSPGSVANFLIGNIALFNAAVPLIVEDVLPPVATNSITAIRYATGSTGPCTIVCSPVPIGTGPITSNILGTLRHGALVTLSGGAETVLVLSTTAGPNGAISFETSTAGTHAAGETITGVPALVVGAAVTVGWSISVTSISSTIGIGTGTISRALGANPFASQIGTSGSFPSPDDYVRISLLVPNVTALIEFKIIFQCGTYDTFTYSSTSLKNIVDGELTELEIPISSLVPSSNQANLKDCSSVTVSLNTSASQSLSISSFCIQGGSQPDVGANGAPYQYIAVPHNTLAGNIGNGSPSMRYGVSPRRQLVTVPLPAAYDSQITLWDVYRYGGSVTSYRFIGSGKPSTNFSDQYFDDTALAGALIQTDNYEPWTSVDLPYSQASSGTAVITVKGTWITLTGAGIVLPGNNTIIRWLPGTLIQLGGQAAYTLRSRPTPITGGYQFEIQESAGSVSPALFTVQEPVLGRQPNSYFWGPDANGFFFACGDYFRPGTVSYTKSYAPDSAPQSYNQDLCPPSEPLLTGAILGGISFGASSDNWWGLYPSFSSSKLFTPLVKNVGRAPVSPWICTDKTRIFFVAKDCIASTTGAGYRDHTEADLYNLFPHEGIAGQDVTRNGITYYAPDYSRAASFRLSVINGYLFFDYEDTSGTRRTLVGRIDHGTDSLGNTTTAWSQDSYANPIRCRHTLEQPEGTLTSTPLATYPLMVMGDTTGNVWAEAVNHNDDSTPISCVLATYEWDGGEDRNGAQWDNAYVDLFPQSAVTATPVMFGVATGAATIIPASTSRQLRMVTVDPPSLLRYLGLQFNWTDNFSSISSPTTMLEWRFYAAPDGVYTWNSQFMSHGMNGFQHIARIECAYASTASVVLDFDVYDGTAPQSVTLPSTGGVYHKVLITLTYNKFMLIQYFATSASPMQMYLDAWTIYLGLWARQTPYVPFHLAAATAE